MKIVVPLAGIDKRFEKLGVYKPLIPIGEKSLIYHVLSHNPFPLTRLFFIILAEHEKKYAVTKKLKNYFGSDIDISVIEKPTQGSPNTILEIADKINTTEDILIELGDVVRSESQLVVKIQKTITDGIIPIDEEFVSSVWGYVVRKGEAVKELREKITKPIVGGATMGLYYFRNGDRFIQYATKMVEARKTVAATGSYFIGPVYNEYIEDNRQIATAKTKILAVLGSPEQIDTYKKTYNL